MADKQSMIFYYDWADDFSEMTDEEVGKLVNAIMKYDMTGEDTDFKDRSLRSVFRHMKKQCDANNEKYKERCKQNSKNAKKRWKNHASACDGINSHKVAFSENAKNADNECVTDNDNDYDPECECVARARASDTHTREAVRSFFQEQGFRSDPDKFIDYNISRGNEQIFETEKRWQATARIWEKNEHPPDEAFDLNKWAAGGYD